MEGTAHELVFPHIWHEQNKSTKEFLKDANLVIGEVSHPSTGQGIEFGWADTMNIPMLFIRKHGAKSSSALKYLKGDSIDYQNEIDLQQKLKVYLAAKA